MDRAMDAIVVVGGHRGNGPLALRIFKIIYEYCTLHFTTNFQ